MSLGLQHEVIVLVFVFGIDPPPAAHAQMEHQHLIAVGMKQAVFRPPRQVRNGRAGHRLDKLGREGTAQVRPVHAHAHQPLSIEKAGKAAYGGFDFRKLGHGCGI